MRLRNVALLCALAVGACGGDSGGPSGPGGGATVTGTYIGDYNATVDPGVTYQGVLQLTQSGSNVTGSLTTNAGRSANVSGSVSASRITATFTFTDACGGSASTTADIVSAGGGLTGTYTASDCLGQYAGGYSLVKQ